MYDESVHVKVNRVEHLNNGRTGTSHFVHCRGVVLITEVPNVLPLQERVHYWCIEGSPLYGGYCNVALYSECPYMEVPLNQLVQH